MTEPKFTPGEWTVLRAKAPIDGEYDYAIMAHKTCIVEAFGRVGETVTAPAYQNAHLIAAAPEMYEALLTCKCPLPAIDRPDDETVESCIKAGTCGCDCGAAIRKALGEAS